MSEEREPSRKRLPAARSGPAAGRDRGLVQRIIAELHHGNRADHAHARPGQGRFGNRRELIASVLELARSETNMDVAVLGEIRDGHETVRQLAGDARSFGLKLGESMPIEETYCQRLLEGRLSNIVPDTRANEQVRDLAVTRAADIGAYIGVPLTTLNARVYVLCCLAHEQQPSLSRRDVVFLRGLGETIAAELDGPRMD